MPERERLWVSLVVNYCKFTSSSGVQVMCNTTGATRSDRSFSDPARIVLCCGRVSGDEPFMSNIIVNTCVD